MSARPLPMPVNPLEAIFLSTFVMISQNRADEKHQVLADHQWQTVQQEEQQNEQLLQLSNQILELTKAIHAMNTARSPTGSNGTEQAARSSTRNAMGDDQERWQGAIRSATLPR
jgi:uncharacterized membrane protein